MLVNQFWIEPVGRLGLSNIFEPLLLQVSLKILCEKTAGILLILLPRQHELYGRLLGGEGGQDRTPFAMSIVRMSMTVRRRSDKIRFASEGTLLE